MASECPMSTASPDTWADVPGVATHRAASSSEPYFRTASSRRYSWYSGERQPLSTTNSTPPTAAAVAARRKARTRAATRLCMPGTPSSKTVVPSGIAPSASPSARDSLRRRMGAPPETPTGDAAVEEDESFGNADAVEDQGASDRYPEITAAGATTRTRPAAQILRMRIRHGVARARVL